MSKFKRVANDERVVEAGAFGEVTDWIGKAFNRLFKGAPMDAVQKGIQNRLQQGTSSGQERLYLEMLDRLSNEGGSAAMKQMLNKGKAVLDPAGQLIGKNFTRGIGEVLDGKIKAPQGFLKNILAPMHAFVAKMAQFDPKMAQEIMDKETVLVKRLTSSGWKDETIPFGELLKKSGALDLDDRTEGAMRVVRYSDLDNVMNKVADYQKARGITNNWITGLDAAKIGLFGGGAAYGLYKGNQFINSIRDDVNGQPLDNSIQNNNAQDRMRTPAMGNPNGGYSQPQPYSQPNNIPSMPVAPSTPYKPSEKDNIGDMFIKSDSNKFRRVEAQAISETETPQTQSNVEADFLKRISLLPNVTELTALIESTKRRAPNSDAAVDELLAQLGQYYDVIQPIAGLLNVGDTNA